MTYRIATIPTVNGRRFYIEKMNGKRLQGGFATEQRAIAKLGRLNAYEEVARKGSLPSSPETRLLRKVVTAGKVA